MSLRLRLTRTITLALLGTLAAGGVLIYRHASHKIETEMRAAIDVGARIAANALSASEEAADPRRRLERVIANFNGDRHLKAMLLGPTGRAEVSSTLMLPEEPAPQWLYQHLSVPPKQVAVTLPAAFMHHGSLMLETDAHNEVAEVWSDMRLYLVILLIFCVLVLSVLYVALGRALRPLQDLTAAFNSIGQGDYHVRVAVGETPEIAALETGFNRMAGQLADMQRRNFRLNAQLETIQEEERVELARNLHDEISPLLFLVDVDATSIRQLAEGAKGPEIVERAQSIQRSAAEMKANVKAILSRLRPSGLSALNLKQSIETIIEFWQLRRPEITFHLAVPEQSWGTLIDSAALSIVRESMNNAMKHARPRTVLVRLEERAEQLVLEVCDDGGGLCDFAPGAGFGVLGMKERASLLGGTLDIETYGTPPGVRVRAEFPLPQDRSPVEAAVRPDTQVIAS